MPDWYRKSAADVLAELKSSARQGLTDDEATHRLDRYGANELIERGLKSPWRILLEQLTSTLVVVLIIAAVISGALGDLKDMIAILAIVVLNALLGFRQEYRAERAMAALKKLAVPVVRLRRGGSVRELSARELVPGDIVLLEAGNLVPADGRLTSAANLRVQEAALTGESEPVEKDAALALASDAGIGDRRNMVFMGTVVTYGHGEAVMTETGMETELGHIADLIQTVESEPTPLQRRLDQLGRNLALVALAIVVVIFVMGLLRGVPWAEMLLTAVSLAVAAVPEGLPAVVTIALSLGAQRMLARHTLIRKLPAVETLGSVTVICSDKTGTLTENRMTVTVLDVAGERLDLIEELKRSAEGIVSVGELANVEVQPALSLLLLGGALCNDVVLEETQSPGSPHGFHIVGDPTEGALAVAAARTGLNKSALEEAFPRIAEAPFDSVRKRMTTVHRTPSAADLPGPLEPIWRRTNGGPLPAYVAFTKGAIDSLMAITERVWIQEHAEPMTAQHRESIDAAHDRLAAQGMRVLAVGFRTVTDAPTSSDASHLEHGLTFIGMIAMIDPPRAEVRSAVELCKQAGIRPMMITGDHPLTARHIAEQLGIATNDRLVSGQELEQMSEDDLDRTVEDVAIYARVSPEHKLNIVSALQRRGHIVAMTGDGVNDAPALKRADIGVAMGITGTDVSKEAAEMVLQDDNFATIVAAVEEGRTIYDNIRKFIRYLLSCNAGEIWVMLLAPLLQLPLPLLPLQILWMNLVTDGLPTLALGVEPAERNVMRRPPYPPSESIFSRGMGRDVIWIGLLMGLAALAITFRHNPNGPEVELELWRTMIFTTLVFAQMALAFAVRSETESAFRTSLLTNPAMIGAVALTFILQIGVIYLPFAQTLFETKALGIEDLLLCLGLAVIPFAGLEIKKWLARRSGN